MTTTPTELETASPETLLDTMVRLTHQLHVVAGYEARGVDNPFDPSRLAGYREQRDLVRAEILRRIEAGS
jgi:hypothetical protein